MKSIHENDYDAIGRMHTQHTDRINDALIELQDHAYHTGRQREREQLADNTAACATVNEYCQQNGIGQPGQSAVLALIEDHKRLSAAQTPPLAAKHTGMCISAHGVLGRVKGQLKFGAISMLEHLNEMATRYYSGDITAVDEFLQLYCLDEKRPAQPGSEEATP